MLSGFASCGGAVAEGNSTGGDITDAGYRGSSK